MSSTPVKVPVIVGKMYPSQQEYFGLEQHEHDMKEIVSKKTNPLQILGKFQGDWLDDLDEAVKVADKVMYTSRDHHSDYLYITRLANYPILTTLSKMPQLLGFEKIEMAQVQFQRPGCLFPAHTDPTRSHPSYIQVLITLAPWEYGQFISFDNTVFCEWDAGTIMYTDFTKTMHHTSNGSSHTRPLLQILGAPGKELQDMIKTGKQRIFQL